MRDLFSLIAARRDDAVTGWRDGAPVTHGAFLARVRAWAALGARSDASRVALYHDDSLEFAAALIGAWLHAQDRLDDGRYVAGQLHRAGWPGRRVLGRFSCRLRGGCSGLPRRLAGSMAHAGRRFRSARRASRRAAPASRTPIPKRFSQLTSEVAALERLFGAGLHDAHVISTVSHQHIYGLLFRVLWPLAAGRPIHAARHEFPETLAPASGAATLRAAGQPGPPETPARAPGLDRRSGHAARRVFVGRSAGAGRSDRMPRCLLGRAPIEVYGSSETGGIAWRRRDAGRRSLDAVARTCDWRIGPAGTLEVRSPHLARCRWLAPGRPRRGMPALAASCCCGRSDRIVKIEEKRISLDAIEAALVASGLVLRSEGASLCQHGRRRQSLAAFVVAKRGRARAAGGRRQAGTQHAPARGAGTALVEAVALPRRWRYLDALARQCAGQDDGRGFAGAAR